MSTSLYELSVASFLQTLSGVESFLQQGEIHAQHNQINADDYLKVRLADDMLPMTFQLDSVIHHTIGCIESIKSGEAGPPSKPEKLDYRSYQDLIKNTQKELLNISAGSINQYEGGSVVFKMGEMTIPFTSENYVLSFALPNLNFHATTAYDILRSEGVKLGKKDYLGKLRMSVKK